MFFVSLMVTTKQKPTVNTQKIKRKEYKHTTTEKYEITKEEIKKRTKEKKLQNSQKTINKLAISPYPPIFTLNVNGLNYLIKR